MYKKIVIVKNNCLYIATKNEDNLLAINIKFNQQIYEVFGKLIDNGRKQIII